ncbi:hypothetical protein ACWKW1_10055 [Brevibacillus parabrevis]|uniref:hypothetical protein n=1 Tax=Brevibacillus parabrevis TaxID=54914 RepID=UPI002E1BABE6|nr:hypothetical protein [Brevibacillus parabrevis]
MLKKIIVLGSALAIGVTAYSVVTIVQQPSSAAAVEKPAVVQSSVSEQLKMLESGIIPTSAYDTAQTWAKAVKLRNGALQYALLTEQARSGLKAPLENAHWVTGASSPWVEGFTVASITDDSAGSGQNQKLKYQVDFDLVTSTGKFGTDRAILVVSQQGDQWFVESVAPASDKSVGIWNTPESLNDQNIEKTFEAMKAYDSKLGYRILLPEKVMSKLKIVEATLPNEEGNPSSVQFYYKDTAAKKDVPLATVVRLTKEQAKLPYYQEHPFLTKIGENKEGVFYSLYPSEHQYAGNEESEQGREWMQLLEMLQARIGKSLQP